MNTKAKPNGSRNDAQGKVEKRTVRTALRARARETFLERLSEHCSISQASRESGIPRQTLYDWRNSDPEFQDAWDMALEMGADVLESEARRRAVDGIEIPVTYRGQLTYQREVELDQDGKIVLDPETGEPKMVPVLDEQGRPKILTVRKYSDKLLIFLLKGAKPEKYGERTERRVTGMEGLGDELVKFHLRMKQELKNRK